MGDLALQTSLEALLRDQECRSAVWADWPEKGQVLLPELALSTLLTRGWPWMGGTMDGMVLRGHLSFPGLSAVFL